MNEDRAISGDPRETTLLGLAEALHEHGLPAHRLEESLARVAAALDLHAAQFLSTPTAMHLALGEGPGQRVFLRRTGTERLDLDAVTELDAIVDDVVDRRIDPPTALRRLDRLHARRPRHGPRAMAWASAAASATAVVFLGGGTAELIVAAALGLGVGWLGRWTALRARVRAVHEPLVAALVSGLTTLVATAVPDFADGVVLVAALIMLVPGLTSTIAMTELASGHVVSGASRLAGAMTLMLTMLFGAALGRSVAAAVPMPALGPWSSLPLPPGSWIAALAAATLAFTVLLGARPRDAGWIAVACGLSYGAAQLGGRALGPELGAFVGALAVGLASNAMARHRGRPATLMRLPGLLLLVPGSLGFRSLGSLLAADTVAGTDGLFRVALVTVALATGMFAADLLLSPRRSL